MKTIQITISEDIHERLRFYAWKTRQTMADAHRQVLAYSLPQVPGNERQDAKPEHDTQADEGEDVKP
jgi:hypothetical protein